MKRGFQAVKGTRDILPPDSALWNHVEQTAREVFRVYNFQEIRLPIFEETELFARSVGADTDIVSKEMYTFEDRDGTSVSLRPEATASVVRAYVEHGLHTRPGLTKLYYIGPMFRRERPQKGRFRQFYQIGAEVLGPSDHPALDAEIIELVMVFIERCGLRGCALYVNSIGCSQCRPKYVETLRGALQKVKSKLGPDSQRRIETNPLRVLDSKVEAEQPLIEKLPSILDHLCSACRDHYEKVKQELKDRGVPFEENWRLVRGLDYYVRTTFEVTAPGLGAQNAVCGGGRYDGLVELLGGPPTKGTGWALGTDRLILALQQATTAKPETPLDVFLVWLGQPAYARARQLARRLRDAGTSVDLTYEEAKLKKALGLADRAGARFALILGENELAQNKITLREMQSGHQRSLSEDELLKELAKPQMHTDEHR
ncbi:MAG: histidine--tRNA ligase [Candidatus Acidoferrales bacterium]